MFKCQFQNKINNLKKKKSKFHAGLSFIIVHKPVLKKNCTVSLTRPQPRPPGLNSASGKRAGDEIMADVRGSAPPGCVSHRPKDTVSSTGAQKCSAGNVMTARFPVLWLKQPVGRNLI